LTIVVVPRKLLGTAAAIALSGHTGVQTAWRAVGTAGLEHLAQTPARTAPIGLIVTPRWTRAAATSVGVLYARRLTASARGFLSHDSQPSSEFPLVVVLVAGIREVRIVEGGFNQARVGQHRACVFAAGGAQIGEHFIEELLCEP